MKKIIVGIFVLTLFVSTGVSAASVKDKTKTTDIACVSTAVSNRENTVMTAWNTLNTKMTALLTARKTSLVTAWGLSEKTERKSAVKKSWDDAKKSRKSAMTEYKNSKKSARTTFKTAVKACGGEVGMEALVEKEPTEQVEI